MAGCFSAHHLIFSSCRIEIKTAGAITMKSSCGALAARTHTKHSIRFNGGPDGRLYGLHGVFTTSEVQGQRLDAAVWRYDVRSKRFEVFAEGTSNPWGMDFDSEGNCFLVCCVIPHLFHIVPGGIYIKQSHKPSYHPYAYGQLREISDHLHHQESGWAHAGFALFRWAHSAPKLSRQSAYGKHPRFEY
jgi:hypothetical protein